MHERNIQPNAVSVRKSKASMAKIPAEFLFAVVIIGTLILAVMSCIK